ncbi:MAG: TonB-dependent receptor [Flavobacteriaceae bacterium]|nr:TonB-dependent receptor [Flavobacteriaceae bacterium]
MLFFLSFLVNLYAQERFTLSGKVIDEQEDPLPGASISLKGASIGVVTDFDGDFSLILADGKNTLAFSYLGYKTQILEVFMTADKQITIQLLPEETALEEVIVSSVRVKDSDPVTHSNITKQELEKRNLGQDIPMLLNYLPSVVTTSDAGAGVGYTGIRVRGSDATRVNVTINGIPYNDAESQSTYWVDLPDFASSTESMQLQRGVGTSTNGSGAFGASLNILTDAVSDTANGELSNSFGSYNTRKHTVKFSTGKINDHIEFAGRFSKINSDGYIDRAWSDLKSYFLQAAYIDDNTLIKAITFGGHEKTYQAWYGVTKEEMELYGRKYNPYTYKNQIDNYQQDHYQLLWNQKINPQFSTNVGLNYTKGKGYYEEYKEDQDFSSYGLSPVTVGNETIDQTNLVRRRWLDNDYYVVNANATYKASNMQLVFGGSYSNYLGNHFGEIIWAQYAGNLQPGTQYYFSDSNKKDANLFAKLSFDLDDSWSLYADLQGRFIRFKTNGLTSDRELLNVNKKYTFFNPKAGVTFKINSENNLYLSIARANREPNREDFKNGVSQAERLNDLEIGWRLNSNQIKLNTNVYYMYYKDQLVLTGAIDDTGDFIRGTSGKSYRFGLEVDADIRITDKISTRPNIALSRNKNLDFYAPVDGNLINLGKTDLSFSPGLIAGNILLFKPARNFQVSLLSKYVGKQYMSNLQSVVSKNDVLESYFVNDINIIYELQPKRLFKSITLTALVNNTFNVKYISNGYYYTYDDTWSNPPAIMTVDGAGYYPQATRNFLIGMTLKF